MKKLLALALSAVLSCQAVGADWLEVGTSTSNARWYVDLSSIRKINVNASGFGVGEPVYSVFAQETYLKGHKLRQHGFYYTKINYYISCNRGAMLENAWFAYDTKDVVVDNWKFKKSYISAQDFTPIIPDTIGEVVAVVVCSRV